MDFSADASFREANRKLKEHYGFELSSEVIRTITLKHAQSIDPTAINANSEKMNVKQLIAECDGGMVPIVETGSTSNCVDRRKKRQLGWKEARLCMSRDENSVKSHFRAT